MLMYIDCMPIFYCFLWTYCLISFSDSFITEASKLNMDVAEFPENKCSLCMDRRVNSPQDSILKPTNLVELTIYY